MCERAVDQNRPSLDLSPIVLEGLRACRGAWDRSGVFLNPNSCMGLEPVPSKEGSWMMAQNDLVVAVMEASGGYERQWAKALRDARIEVRIVDPNRVRRFAQSAGRQAKNDTIDAEMIAWFAETFAEARGQAYDATREQLHQMVHARQALKDMQSKLTSHREHAVPAAVQRIHARISKTIAVELVKIEAEISALIQATPHFAELAEIIESVPGLARTTSAALAAMPELGQTMTTVDDVEANGTSRADGARPATYSIWPAL